MTVDELMMAKMFASFLVVSVLAENGLFSGSCASLVVIEGSKYDVVRSEDGSAMCASDTPSQTIVVKSNLQCTMACQTKTSRQCREVNYKPAINACELYFYQPIWFSAQAGCVHMQAQASALAAVPTGLNKTTCDLPYTYFGAIYYSCSGGQCLTSAYTKTACNGDAIGYTATYNNYVMTTTSFVAPVRSINGWIVMMEYIGNNPYNWNRPWNDYQNGFGSLGNNYWIGLNRLTEAAFGLLKLRIEGMVILGSAWMSFEINYLKVASETDNYRVTLGSLSGDPEMMTVQPDVVSTHNKMPFSTYDHDSGGAGCPAKNGGGWWFNTGPCYAACSTCAGNACNTLGVNGMQAIGNQQMGYLTTPSCFTVLRALLRPI